LTNEKVIRGKQGKLLTPDAHPPGRNFTNLLAELSLKNPANN